MRLLLLTLYAPIGGVPATTQAFASALRDLGHDVTIAFSVHRTAWPHLSVRPWQIGSRHPGIAKLTYLGYPAVAVGAYVPELECLRYKPHSAWQDLIGRYDACVGVLGSVLPAYVFAASGRRALCWVGTPYVADRKDRARDYPALRKIFDRIVEQPICELLERVTLRAVDVLTVSPYTEAALREIEPCARLAGVLQPPVDLSLFRPGPAKPRLPYRIGFCGRVEDPRKNIGLLIAAASELRRRAIPVEVHVFGGLPSNAVSELVARQGLSHAIAFHERGSVQDLVRFYQSLDLFVIPSHQEGFGVVGIEAMACGVPVVSTPCGGPAAYVQHDCNGIFVGFDAPSMADGIERLLTDAALRRQMSQAALEQVRAHNSPDAFRASLATQFARWLPGSTGHGAREAA